MPLYPRRCERPKTLFKSENSDFSISDVLHTSTRPTFESIFPLSHNTDLHPSLLCRFLSLITAMQTRFYRGLSDTKHDGGGLQ